MEERFTTPNCYPTEALARKARDSRARELRNQGFVVTCKKYSFSGFGYGVSFVLKYDKPAQ